MINNIILLNEGEMSSISISDLWYRGRSLLIGLSVNSINNFPLVIGMSIQTPEGEIVDIPARYILSPGFSFWGQEQVDNRFAYPKDESSRFCNGWRGRIIFAVYSDSSFNHRLADTGWVEFDSINLMGSSLKGLDYQDDEIEHKRGSTYASRQAEVWASLGDRAPVDIWKPFLI
jgi:hypothetical protein